MPLPQSDVNISSSGSAPHSSAALFLICGLGGLGQYCADILIEFGVRVYGISAAYPSDWEVPELPDRLDGILVGDYRQQKILEQANIHQAQAILLVANDEPANIEAAFTARLLNPKIRIVIRSAKQNLNALLTESLGNVVAFEPNQLATSAFALAALGGETQAIFQIEDEVLRVMTREVQGADLGLGRSLYEFNHPQRKLLDHHTAQQLQRGIPENKLETRFHHWNPIHNVAIADSVTFIQIGAVGKSLTALPDQPLPELGSKSSRTSTGERQRKSFSKQLRSYLTVDFWQQQGQQLWEKIDAHPTRRIAVFSAILILGMILLGTILYQLFYPKITLLEAFHATMALLLGGYGDVFGGVELDTKTPTWLHLFSLLVALLGTAFVGILYALLTDNLLTARLTFLKRRQPIPKEKHIILIGLEAFGQTMAAFLQDLKQPLVGVNQTEIDPVALDPSPVLIGDPIQRLQQANLSTALSVLVATENEMTNLEIGLAAHAQNPQTELVIRMFDQRFSQTLQRLLPYAKVLCTHALAAEAFAGAAFGENILGLFRLGDQTVLVTEYYVEPQDMLIDRLMGQVAYGYDIVPILHQKHQQGIKWFPSDDTRLALGDRLVVLATIASLQHIERGDVVMPRVEVMIAQVSNPAVLFEGASIIARIVGCSRETASDILAELPATLPMRLYPHQAQRLLRHLRKNSIQASISLPLP